MPQFWLSYDELAALTGCDVESARATAAAIPLDRRKSHDGLTRVKLNASLTERFLDSLLQQRIDQHLRACASQLGTMHQRMAATTAHAAPSAAHHARRSA